MAGRDEVEIPVLQNEISDMRTTIGLLTDTVTSLELSMASLLTDVKGLMATGDGGVYGETYTNDVGPAGPLVVRFTAVMALATVSDLYRSMS